MSKVSLIIPVYNVETYLERCIESVLNQTYKDLEIILVNDGSTDTSGAMCDNFSQQDKRIKVIHQLNAGLSEARNTGLKHITGEFVMFVDSDDWLEKDAVSFLLEQLQRNNADMVVGGVSRTSEVKQYSQSNIEVVLMNQEEYAKKYFKIGSQSIEYYVWNKLYRKEIVEDILYPSGFFAEDVPTTFQYILKSEKIVVTNKIIYNYFINPNSLTSRFTERYFDVLKGWDLVYNYAAQSSNKKYIEWAKLNRYRADLALLTEIALASNYKELRKDFSKNINQMLSDLRLHRGELIEQPIPVNRKILVILFTVNFNIFSNIINKLSRLRNYVK